MSLIFHFFFCMAILLDHFFCLSFCRMRLPTYVRFCFSPFFLIRIPLCMLLSNIFYCAVVWSILTPALFAPKRSIPTPHFFFSFSCWSLPPQPFRRPFLPLPPRTISPHYLPPCDPLAFPSCSTDHPFRLVIFPEALERIINIPYFYWPPVFLPQSLQESPRCQLTIIGLPQPHPSLGPAFPPSKLFPKHPV